MIKEISQQLISRQITSLELTQHYLQRIKKENPKINAYISVLEKEALAAAKESDIYLAKKQPRSEVEGIPLAIKDNICLEGTLTTCGSKILSNFIAPYDATVIDKLKKGGAVFLGKTNMDEFAMGSSTETSYFGPTKNPLDPLRVPGGSSGGSAAAVAADLCVAALGSDTGGSIRQPAAFCGIVGFKPTYGAVSRFGLIAMASSLDQIGPLTKTVSDAAILFKIISGYDAKDSTSLHLKETIFQKSLKEVSLGIPKEYLVQGLNRDVKANFFQTIKKIENLGVKIKEISLTHTEYALAVYYLIMPSEVSSNLARYDGMKYGYSENKNFQSPTLSEVYFSSRAKGFGDEVKRRIILGTFALSAGYYEAYYLKAKKVQAKIKEDFDKAFEKVDFLITPTTPTPAFKLGEKIDRPLEMYLSDIFTVPVNLAGLPAISLPVSSNTELPLGIQIIGRQGDDFSILKFANELFQHI